MLVPAQVEGVSRFTIYQQGLELALEENVTMPPKDIFFPQTEKMYKFKTQGKSWILKKFNQKRAYRLFLEFVL